MMTTAENSQQSNEENMRWRFVHRPMVALAIMIAVSGNAFAADMPTKAAPLTPAPAIPGWTFSLTPYAWAISLDGSATVKGRTTDVDANFFSDPRPYAISKRFVRIGCLGRSAL